MITAGDDPERVVADSAWRRHQMPAYHLVAPDRSGISLVNIGVGPSNAKTITDHLAVVRPDAWLMIGHCGGLRPSQRIGDYVLAHAYLRDRSEEHTSELQSLMRISYAVFCLKKKKQTHK